MEQMYDLFANAGLEHLANIDHHLKRIADHLCGQEKVNIPLNDFIKEPKLAEETPVEAKKKPVDALSHAEGTTAPRGGWKKPCGSRRWTAEEDTTLKQLRQNGHGWTVIAVALNRTPKGCEDRALTLYHAGTWPADVKRTPKRAPRV